MASNYQLGYPQVPKSITNSNVQPKDALDTNYPMSFLDFIKTITVSFEPDSLQKYYNEYVRRWNSKKNNSSGQNQNIITERYRNFLKEISLNYTTIEERKFLSQIDFNDPYDLEVVIPFYSKKLKEISEYYNTKREDLKLEIYRKKYKGSNFGTQKTLEELVTNYLKNLQEGNFSFNYNDVIDNFRIEVEELYDDYPEYFNQEPDENLYDNKDLDYGENIFILDDETLIKDVFPDLSQELKNLKEVDSLFENKRKLTSKYLATDFYYLSTGSTVTDFISGRILENENSSSNFLNRDYPTTASTRRSNFSTSREKGFFKPSKHSIILIDGKNSSFSFNFENLSPNTLYYFPDPSITGENGDVLNFYVDDSFLKRKITSGVARNQPINNDSSNNYYGYSSRKELDNSKYFNDIFNKGYVKDFKRDIFNNLYGLFQVIENYNKEVQYVDPNQIKSLQLNGGDFFDELYGEGFNFNYSTYDDTTYLETLRSSLTSNTNGLSSLNSPYTLFFRYFSPYEELKSPSDDSLNKEYVIRDGGFLTKKDGGFYDDPISSDLSAFPGNSQYYYNTLLEGGIADSGPPIQRALVDPSFPTLTANLTQSVRPSGNNDVFLLDGGKLNEEFNFDFSFSDPSYEFINEINDSYKTSFESNSASITYLNERKDLEGTLFIKNNITKETKGLFESIPYLKTKHNQNVVSELSSSLKNFEVSNDTLFLETSSYLIIEKIDFSNGNYIDPKSNNISIQHNSDSFEKISNRFKADNKVYFCNLKTFSESLSNNNFRIYPEIYKYDLVQNRNEKIFPVNDSLVTQFFSCSGNDIRYIKSGNPKISYSSRNDIFNISFLLKDQNELFSIHEYDLKINPNIEFIKHTATTPLPYHTSNIFTSTYDSNLTVYMSGSPVNINNETIII